jgi:predicted Zn-dependent peptidase
MPWYTYKSMNPKSFDPYDFSFREIAGVPVYYKHLPWAPCLHIRWSFSSGAFADPKGKEGLAHFLEHIIGNGSPTLPNKKAMREFSKLYMLGSRNALTSHYWTDYVGKCLPEHAQTVLERMVDYIFRPFMRAEDVEHERKVITQEAWERYVNAKFLGYVKEIAGNVYHGHERSRIASPLGWPETVANITHEDIKDFHGKHYVKKNLTLMLVGAVDEKILKNVGEVLETIREGEKVSHDFGHFDKPKKLRLERDSESIGIPREQVSVSFTRVVPKGEWSNEEVGDQARALLYDVLFERLRIEHSLCYSVSVEWRNYDEYLEVVVEVETSEDKIPLVEKEVWAVIDEIAEGKWRDRFALIHKSNIDRIRSNERTSDLILSSALAELHRTGKIIPLEQSLEEAAKVSYESVGEFLKRVFEKDSVFTNIILPSKK